MEVISAACEPTRSEQAAGPEVLARWGGADRLTLPRVCFDFGCERPRMRAESLSEKTDGLGHPIWNAPAWIAGETAGLDVAIKQGGAAQSLIEPIRSK